MCIHMANPKGWHIPPLATPDLPLMYINRLYAELYNMFIIFHAWYQNTFVHAWRGMFQRDNFLRSCEVSFCSGCDRRNSFEREIIIGNNVSD